MYNLFIFTKQCLLLFFQPWWQSTLGWDGLVVGGAGLDKCVGSAIRSLPLPFVNPSCMPAPFRLVLSTMMKLVMVMVIMLLLLLLFGLVVLMLSLLNMLLLLKMMNAVREEGWFGQGILLLFLLLKMLSLFWMLLLMKMKKMVLYKRRRPVWIRFIVVKTSLLGEALNILYWEALNGIK